MRKGLTRRELLALAPLAGAGRAPASDGEMMWDYLEGQLTRADESRRRRLAGIRSRSDLSALQEKTRRSIHTGIGAFPERTDLRARQTGELRKSDYAIEKIIFESRPNYFVTANVYRPLSTAPRRAAVVQSCGHYVEGKAAADYQRACIGLAKKGIIALIFDPMGQGERYMFVQPGQKRPGATYEHSLAGKPTLLVGRTLAHYRMWDAIRALDYLESRPDVDGGRLGMLGHSGGGMMTLLTAPLEPRIRAAMSCCAVTTFFHKTMAQLMADPEQVVPGIYANGIDHPELIATAAPRAFLVGAVLRDFVPLEGTRRTFEEVRPIYEMLGAGENFAKVESDNVHMLDRTLREGCYGWMLKHLTGESGNAREPEMEVETEENLRCTKTGRVMDLEGARSVFDLNLARAAELEESRRGQSGGPAALLALAKIGGRRVSPARFESEPGIEVPVTQTRGRRRGEMILLAAAEGRNSEAAKEFAEVFAGAGFSVISADLRGWGETACTRPKKARFEWDEFLAWRAMEMGRPLVGMRVQDLLAVAGAMAGEHRRIYAVGVGAAGVVALHAAAVEPKLAGVATWRTMRSYREAMQRRDFSEPVSSLVWGALTAYDLPEIRRRLGSRPAVATEGTAGEAAHRIVLEFTGNRPAGTPARER
jgi:dienelactone hydrolase